ncbi:MAG: gamma-glutamyltransferase [Ignavibacteria bacterium]|nr:gamma-glutamyltransferase [Ignavibacteria bacterium]
MYNFRKFLVVLLVIFLSCGNGKVVPQKVSEQKAIWFLNYGAISSADELATEIGMKILKEGGNAIDAAVGIGFALAVVYPQAGNLGGGGFFVIHLADGRDISIDFREMAPIGAHKNMFLDEEGNVIEGLSTTGHLAAAVPGSVAGLLYALEKYGTMPRKDVMKYAIELAEKGFSIKPELAQSLNANLDDFKKFESTKKIFGKKFKAGDILIQKDLAYTLKKIRDEGKDGFYKGEIADKIIKEMKRGGGIISYDDLNGYTVKEREVLKGTYRDYEIITMPPPSSGGICLLYLLNILENFNLSENDLFSAENIHLMVEAMRRVYADRSEHLGDADFYPVPVDILISKDFAKEMFKDFDNKKATPSSEILPVKIHREGENTTHYSVADKYGNLVAVTTTINDTYGCKVIVDGAGFFLNNEMDDFSIKPGVPNIFGLLGSVANEIQPKKRPLSSMTPTIVFKNKKPFLVLGSPGGGKIITTVLHTIIRVIDFKLPLDEAIDLPRFHHQWYPDEIQVERELLDGQTQKKLLDMGHKIKQVYSFGRVDAIMFLDDNTVKAHSDIRGYGKAIVY